MPAKFTNNGASTLAIGISATATSITVQADSGALFPTLSAGDYFYATLANVANELEIVRVTGRSVDTLIVQRGQEGTTARAYSAGARIEARITAAILTAFEAARTTGAGHADRTDNPHATTASQVGAYTKAESDALLNAKAPTTHTHTIGDVTSLQATLDGKAAASHSHSISEVSGLQTALDGKAAASHTHPASAISGLDGVYFRAIANASEFTGTDAGAGYYLAGARLEASGSTLTLVRTYAYLSSTSGGGDTSGGP
jgi:hypothetical protein